MFLSLADSSPSIHRINHSFSPVLHWNIIIFNKVFDETTTCFFDKLIILFLLVVTSVYSEGKWPKIINYNPLWMGILISCVIKALMDGKWIFKSKYWIDWSLFIWQRNNVRCEDYDAYTYCLWKIHSEMQFCYSLNILVRERHKKGI